MGGLSFDRRSSIRARSSWVVENSRLTHSAQSLGSRENNSSIAWSSRENRSYERSRLSIQASSSWAVEGEQGQIAVRCGRERPGKVTLWLRSRGSGHRNAQGVDRENPDEEEGESSFGEHDGMWSVVRKKR